MTSTKRLTYEYVKEYIESFGYTLLEKEYKNNKTKMKIRCDKGHVYYSHFSNFKNGCRCPECKKIKHTESQTFTYKEVKEFIESIGYTLLEDTYIKGTIKMKMICDHGHEIKMTFKSLRHGYRCPKCGKIHMAEKKKFTYEYVKDYIENEGYQLLSKEYINGSEKIEIRCPKGHTFKMRFHNFNQGQRCSICRTSKGEEEIFKFLKYNNIKCERQYKFKDCKYKKRLPFDFYLPDYNICIEFDGEQHYRIGGFSGDIWDFVDIKIRDTIKTVYCENNNIKLLRIPYCEFNDIENILKEKLLIK